MRCARQRRRQPVPERDELNNAHQPAVPQPPGRPPVPRNVLGLRVRPRRPGSRTGRRNPGDRRPLVLALRPGHPPGLPIAGQPRNAGLPERRLPAVPTTATGLSHARPRPALPLHLRLLRRTRPGGHRHLRPHRRRRRAVRPPVQPRPGPGWRHRLRRTGRRFDASYPVHWALPVRRVLIPACQPRVAFLYVNKHDSYYNPLGAAVGKRPVNDQSLFHVCVPLGRVQMFCFCPVLLRLCSGWAFHTQKSDTRLANDVSLF